MPKKILVIDDSALMRRVISDIINEGNEYEVDAIARDGLEGFDLIISNPTRYSAVILDINMPKMNGIELLAALQKNHIHQTVIVVSTVAKDGAKETIQALENGAFDFVTKPENYLETKSQEFKKKIHTMLDIATAKETPRLATSHIRQTQTTSTFRNPISKLPERVLHNDVGAVKVNPDHYTRIKHGMNKLIALACSTGGPKSLQQIIPMLPKNLDAPMVLVQHMPAGFTASLAQRLNEISDIRVKEAQDGDVLEKGMVYLAPGGNHIRVVKSGTNHKIKISTEPAVDGLRPCANIMYHSLLDCDFDEITCVVLTGMGSDGTKGIKELSEGKKKLHVIAQDADSSVVYGMPKAIAQTGLTDRIVPLIQVAEEITKNVGVL